MNNPIARRAERSLLTGALAGILAMIIVASHHHYIAAAAAQHESVTKYMLHDFLVVGGVTAVVLFVLASIITASRNSDRARRSAPASRPRRQDW